MVFSVCLWLFLVAAFPQWCIEIDMDIGIDMDTSIDIDMNIDVDIDIDTHVDIYR